MALRSRYRQGEAPCCANQRAVPTERGSSFCTSAVMSASSIGLLGARAGDDAVEMVLDDVGDLQAVVAGERVPLGQQRQLLDGGVIVRVLGVEGSFR